MNDTVVSCMFRVNLNQLKTKINSRLVVACVISLIYKMKDKKKKKRLNFRFNNFSQI